MAPQYPEVIPPRGRRWPRLTTLRLVREGSFRAPMDYPLRSAPIRGSKDVFVRMAPYTEREAVESFWILALNRHRRVAGPGPTVITRGILDGSLVYAREIFAAAIVAHAASIILVHNHPSGDPAPSAEDRSVTRYLVAAGDMLGIPVHDHAIIGHRRYMSFADAGLL